MQRTQPNTTAEELTAIVVPVMVVQSEHNEFIKREHAELSKTDRSVWRQAGVSWSDASWYEIVGR